MKILLINKLNQLDLIYSTNQQMNNFIEKSFIIFAF